MSRLATCFVALCAAAFLVGCGDQTSRSRVRSAGDSATTPIRSGAQKSSGKTSLAYDVSAYLFPRSGADWAAGQALINFKVAQVDKTRTACMARDGLPGPPKGLVPPQQYGNAELPNLPVIERTFSIGVTTRIAPPTDPTSGMSRSEAAAYQAALKKCSRQVHTSLGVLSSGPTDALRVKWLNITSDVIASEPVANLNQQATRCAARTGFPANSVQNEVARIASKITPLNLSNDQAGARSTEIAGTRVLIRCFGPEVRLTDQLLAQRRTQFFAANAQAINQIGSAIDRAVGNLNAKQGTTT